MIEISIQRGAVTITGHAGYAPPGRDIVCAAVSVLFQTMVQAIHNLTEDTITYYIKPGRSQMSYGSLSEKSKTLVDSFFTGISMLAGDYPDYVRII